MDSSKRKIEAEAAAPEMKRCRPDEREEAEERFELMDFSDDVLLKVLSYCAPRELKALSFCCSRLARLSIDRSLWRRVELRRAASGAEALAFYARCLQPTTEALCVRGLRRASSVAPDSLPPDASEKLRCHCVDPESSQRAAAGDASPKPYRRPPRTPSPRPAEAPPSPPAPPRSPRPDRDMCGNSSPKPFELREPTPPPPPRPPPEAEPEPEAERPECCRGRRFCPASLTRPILERLRRRCRDLVELRLERCQLDCNPFRVADLPASLRVLSFKGSHRTVAPYQSQFLAGIQDRLPRLEELDLSYCHWVTSYSLILLSKVARLRKLLMRGCPLLVECVAYSGLATRFGFKALEVLDVRETNVGDSEVSSFGSLDSLRELYVQAPAIGRPGSEARAFARWPEHDGRMEPWERRDPRKEVEEYISELNDRGFDDRPASDDEKADKKDEKPANPGDGGEPSNRNEFEASAHNLNVYYRSRPRGGDDADGRGGEREDDERDEVGIRVGVEVIPIGIRGRRRLPVDVRVGFGAIRVGLGAENREDADARGEVRVDVENVGGAEPERRRIRPRVRVDVDGDRERHEGPISVRVRGIEVQVGRFSIELQRGPAAADRDGEAGPAAGGEAAGPAAPEPPRGEPERPGAEAALVDAGDPGAELRELLERRLPPRPEPQRRPEPEVPPAPRGPPDPRRDPDDFFDDALREAFGRGPLPGRGPAIHHDLVDGRVHVIYIDPDRGVGPIDVRDEPMRARGNAPAQVFQLPLRNRPPMLRRVSVRSHRGELVTDASLLRIGDSERLIVVGGPAQRPQPRPRRLSRLEVLHCRGYAGVTDRSLSHLAASAPALRVLDIEGCGVTTQGVATFAMVRPDCAIKHVAK